MNFDDFTEITFERRPSRSLTYIIQLVPQKKKKVSSDPPTNKHNDAPAQTQTVGCMLYIYIYLKTVLYLRTRA